MRAHFWQISFYTPAYTLARILKSGLNLNLGLSVVLLWSKCMVLTGVRISVSQVRFNLNLGLS